MSDKPAFLYVEDDLFSRRMMTMLMKQGLGYENFTIFEDSAAFLSRLDALPTVPDVIFLDIHIQPVDGFEMLKLLRNSSTYANTTVIALTASVMNEELSLLQKAGFDGCIAKPLDSDIFPSLLEKILNGENVWHI